MSFYGVKVRCPMCGDEHENQPNRFCPRCVEILTRYGWPNFVDKWGRRERHERQEQR
jgi:hypothetical protein